MDGCSVTQSSLALFHPMNHSPPGASCPWDSPGQNSGAGCHFLLPGIFLTQGSTLGLPGLPHCRQVLYPPKCITKSRCCTPETKHNVARQLYLSKVCRNNKAFLYDDFGPIHTFLCEQDDTSKMLRERQMRETKRRQPLALPNI